MSDPEPGVEEEAVAFADEAEADKWELEDTEEDRLALAEAEADIAAGRVISHAAVSRWLRSLATDNPLPKPQPGE